MDLCDLINKMASGVKVNDACLEMFKQMKLGHQHKFIIFALTDDLSEIVVSKTRDKTGNYDEFCEELRAAEQNKQCRYGLFDAKYTLANGQPKEKIVFFHWSPDTSAMKQKMLYSSSKEYLRKTFGHGIGVEIQANDHGDLEWDGILSKLQQTDRS